ncbi:ShlB/FhaC/HecB family hemolysin secretion/activation protein [Roseibium aggregatum]|uniref:ShlB/FhaC/HecB family hemolysin secretion/activation protein n=1 Tax=Roseibium aggregatum TaxID=187304 RepID=UPI001E341F2D|nr:ShlB/FhaC/HecB family hemolysin secretion/activation protein [Roseibium aggregatum]UES54438.1 ShlB/FhaC/HecB family hemolysin secretion/activation protein [Roseibium aggregatum]
MTRHTITAALVAGLALVSEGSFAQQALERNLPAAEPGEPVSLDVAPQDFGATDRSPIGVDLAGVYLIGQSDDVVGRAPKGIGGPAAAFDQAALDAVLSEYLGKPLSLALAGEIQAAIARVYKDAGYPFVSVTLPPQEITGGVLQVRVIEFKSGNVTVQGLDERDAEEIRARLRINPGGRIDARALEEDLGWLNRSPYRRAGGVFRPGEDAALSDLEVTIDEGRPWQVFAGWSNSGSQDTGRDRYFLGGNARLPFPGGPWLSYQMTASDDLWSDPGIVIPREDDYPSYVSHAGRLTIPTWARQSLEIAPALVASRETPNRFFDFENTTYELPIIYRSAVSNLLPGRYWGDIYTGVELKRLERTTFFNGVAVADGAADLFQMVLGWSNSFDDRLGRTVVDVRVKANPGGVLQGNAATTWQTFTNGRVQSVDYAYLAADISRTTSLPNRFFWVSALSGTLAGQVLPDTERISLGGRYAVRGYNYDDASVDSGVIWRNELRLPSVSPLAGNLPESWPQSLTNDSLSAYLFVDIGFGIDHATDDDATLSGVGAGFDYALRDNLTANLIAGVALQDAGETEAGDLNLQASITARF